MKGQEFTVFRILIGAAFAFTLLIIIIASIQNLPNPMTGREAVRDLVLNAARVPGTCFENKIFFQDGETIAGKDIGRNTGKDIYMYPDVDAVVCTSESCFVPHKIKLDVSVICSTSSCDVHFGTSC